MFRDPLAALKTLVMRVGPVPFPEEATDVQEVSGKIIPGAIFVAIRGTRVNGHHYIKEAVARGAGGIVLEDPTFAPDDCPWVQVTSSRRALGELASRAFGNPSRQFCLIGITGTNGKTSTSFILESMLQAGESQVGLIGTVVQRSPLREISASGTTPPARELQATLSQLVEDHVQATVMEVTSHGLDMDRTAGCEFDGALLTNLTRDHLDYHQTMEKYRAAKLKLLAELSQSSKPRRFAAWWTGDPAWSGVKVPDGCRLLTYGEEASANVRVQLETMSIDGMSGRLHHAGEEIPFSSPLIGRHNLINIAAAAAAAIGMGIDAVAITAGIANLHSIPGRLERVRLPRPYAVFVDYAHTPDALEKVLGSLKALQPKRLLVVFGCGGDRDRGKRPLMGGCVARGADMAFVTSDNPRSEAPDQIMQEILSGMTATKIPVVTQSDRRQAIALALDAAKAGDIVLIAGKGHESYQIIGAQKLDFDDRQVLRELV